MLDDSTNPYERAILDDSTIACKRAIRHDCINS